MTYNDTVNSIVTRMLESGEVPKSSWAHLAPENQSEHEGWTKAGEFACPNCGVGIGKNLKGESPFASAAEHTRQHTLPPLPKPPEGHVRNNAQYDRKADLDAFPPSEYEHDFNTLKNRY
jgi:hypothetical protein